MIDNLTPEEKETYSNLIMPVDTDIKLDSVILSDENKRKITEFLNEYKHREQLLKYRLKPINRILMYGASGTGKTYLSKALSNHMKYTMLYVDIAQALSTGNVATNMADIFKLANSKKNCIIFFDECDSIAWRRDSASAESGTVRRATNSLFQELDQMDYSNVFISATNMLKRIDPAFERRFDMKMEFRKPDKPIEEVVTKFLFKEFNLNYDVSVEQVKIIQRKLRLSYYEIQIITERNMKKAVIAGTLEVKLSDILQDIGKHMGMKTVFGTLSDNEEVMYSSSLHSGEM